MTFICQERCVRENKGASDTLRSEVMTCCTRGPLAHLNASRFLQESVECRLKSSYTEIHTPHLQACVWTCRRHTPPPALGIRGHRVGQNKASSLQSYRWDFKIISLRVLSHSLLLLCHWFVNTLELELFTHYFQIITLELVNLFVLRPETSHSAITSVH